MGPKAKKPVINAFSLFLNEYVISEREKGRQISHRVAAEECGPLWEELNEKEKKKYHDLAVVYKARKKEDKYNKFTNTGISYAQLEQDMREMREKAERADNEIKTTISNLDRKTLKTHLFYMIHCNYYCKTFEGLYVPGELAIVEFSLGDGIRRTYHTLINPGPIPMGFAFEAKRTIEEVHGLPYPPYDEGDSDYFGILHKVLDFLEPGKLPDGRYPPLYCIENNIQASENILGSLSDNQNEGENFFRVMLLPKMFFWLKNKCVEDITEEHVGFPVMCNAETEISKDIFCYVAGISCPFHAVSEDKYHSCSLSVVQRFVYVICDHCCQYLGVDLIPGKHCRFNCDVKGSARSKHSGPSLGYRSSGPPSEFGGSQGMSSYGESLIGFDSKRGGGAGSFLHDELDWKFNNVEISSTSSNSTFFGPSASNWRTSGERRPGRTRDQETEEDRRSFASFGRGRI